MDILYCSIANTMIIHLAQILEIQSIIYFSADIEDAVDDIFSADIKDTKDDIFSADIGDTVDDIFDMIHSNVYIVVFVCVLGIFINNIFSTKFSRLSL